MNEEKRNLTENEKRLLQGFNGLSDEWKIFIVDFLRIATEQEGRGVEETLAIMRKKNMATPEMLERAKNILDAKKGR